MNTARATNLLAFAILAVVSGGSMVALGGARHAEGTDNAYVEGDVTPISARIAGYVVYEGVRDHQAVRAGDLLYRIDDADYRARAAQARADVAGRVAALAALDEELELQGAAIRVAEARVRGALAGADRTQREHLRTVSLKAGGWVSDARTEQTWAAEEQAASDVESARAGLAAARQRAEVIASERGKLEAARNGAEATLRLAEVDLRSTEIRAPSDGAVGERQVRVGQYVRPGTQMIALVEPRIWVTANFKETQLAGVAPGRRVRVQVDSAAGVVLDGVVESVSPASGAEFALLRPDNATGNFTRIVQRIPVKIGLSPAQARAARLAPGMSAKVRLVD